MMRIGLIVGLAALVVTGLGAGAVWLRKDAEADLLRKLQIQQAERTAEDVAEREARKKEIENATPDELWARACAGGMLPPDTCP